jgi:hypothetical protein
LVRTAQVHAHACRDGLFTVIKMQEAANFLLGIGLGAFFLKQPDAQHSFQQVAYVFCV